MTNIHQRIDQLRATKFQKSVWHFTAIIPQGKTATYAQVAIAIGHPKAVRAVGNALNRNPLAPEVPCHRVIRSGGAVGGFASGIKKKLQLLRSEGYHLSNKR